MSSSFMTLKRISWNVKLYDSLLLIWIATRILKFQTQELKFQFWNPHVNSVKQQTFLCNKKVWVLFNFEFLEAFEKKRNVHSSSNCLPYKVRSVMLLMGL